MNVNSSGIGGLSFSSASDCDVLSVSCLPSRCGVRGQPGAVEFLEDGKPTSHREWPWHVRVYPLNEKVEDLQMCDGILISPAWVMTSRNCFLNIWNAFGANLAVGGGSWTKDKPSWTSSLAYIRLDEDINLEAPIQEGLALLKLETTRSGTNSTEPVCLPNDYAQVSPRCYMIGWGGDSADNGLRETRVQFTTQNCDRLKQSRNSGDRNDCIKFTSNHTTCAIDKGFGSPVVCQDVSGRWTVEGLSFQRSECYRGDVINVVTRIRDFLTAIETTTACPFRCSDRDCVYSLDQVCDGQKLCSDDENEEMCYGISCSFDYGNICGYQVSPYSPSWMKLPGGVMDTTTGLTGSYMEAVAFANETTAEEGWLKSPVMTSPLSGCLVFQYFLIGSPAVELDVAGVSSDDNVTVSTLLSLRGDFGVSWRKASVRLDSSSYHGVMFIARGVDAVSYIALDDIQYPVDDCEPGETILTY
ncbi:transmembrane protease serine 11G-like [Liolophura sinensis]|uniref:transmembrane protease serine 11G-like n=1 Tax=Liolophura sinensis TaxID=3198878 RepID=UPI0031597372